MAVECTFVKKVTVNIFLNRKSLSGLNKTLELCAKSILPINCTQYVLNTERHGIQF